MTLPVMCGFDIRQLITDARIRSLGKPCEVTAAPQQFVIVFRAVGNAKSTKPSYLGKGRIAFDFLSHDVLKCDRVCRDSGGNVEMEIAAKTALILLQYIPDVCVILLVKKVVNKII